MESCPACAISKDPVTGAVIIDPDFCLGCKYCTWACPYDAPRFQHTRGIVEKCDFCTERLKKGEAPACVCACPTKALRIRPNEIDSPSSSSAESISQRIEGFTQTELQPSIRFKPLRSRQRVPEYASPLSDRFSREIFDASLPLPKRKITLKSEWALLVFTSIAYILTALFTASLVVSLPINPFLFAGAGALGMVLSTVHLGKKARMFRAVFNIKSSWLSREIFLFSSFLGISTLYLYFSPPYPVIGWVGAAVGFLSLFAVDRIYQVAMKVTPVNFHSAHTLFNSLYLLCVLIQDLWLIGLFGGIKILLYIYRKWYFIRQERKVFPIVSLSRIILGFILPFVFYAGGFGWGIAGLIIAGVTAGELIDRIEFYYELDIITPRKQVLIDLYQLLRAR